MSLFRAIAKALVKNVGNFASGFLGAPIAGDILVDTWEYWTKDSADEAKRKAELEGYARQAVKDVLPEALQAVRLEASQLPEPQRQVIVGYLCQVPATIQRSLRRPEDRSGTTIPRGQALRSANDLAQFLPPTLPRFRPGDALPGRPGWVLERHLGGGGFGEVWLVRETSFGSQYAVKFFKGLQNDLRQEGNVIARVMRESKAHQDIIVPLRDAYLDGELPWLAYDYVEGGTLAEAIERLATLPTAERLQQSVKSLQMLARAAGHFHRLQPPIVHRDLKPANILYDSNRRRLRITDFGIGGIAAREMLDGEKRGTLTNGDRLQSYLYGSYTPLYASPQQRAGAAPDPRDDVHALGIIAYQMMTGQISQGVGPDYAHDLHEHGVGEALIALLGRCTAQKAERRPRDAAELAELLEPCIERDLEYRSKSFAPVPARVTTASVPPNPVEVPAAVVTGKSAGDLRSDNTLGMKLVWCPAGRFTMGSPASETERSDDEEQVEVTLTKGFWLGQTGVTQSQFKAVMASEPWSGNDCVKEGVNYPATYVDWNDATEFCKRLTESEGRAGRLPQGWKYDLPTEAQREYATRAGTTMAYVFGNDAGKLSDYAWFHENAIDVDQDYAHEVGAKKPNAWGLYDLHGNMWEWCRDYYAKKLPGGVDPFVGTGSNRVFRGGCWFDNAANCRSAYRFRPPPDIRYSNPRFRLALVPSS